MAFDFKPTGGGAKPKSGFSVGETPDDPLKDVEYTDNVGEDSKRELDALQQAYRARASAEAGRFQKATDSEYWFAVYFEDREECERFQKAVGLKKRLHGDKYIDGKMLAKLLKIDY